MDMMTVRDLEEGKIHDETDHYTEGSPSLPGSGCEAIFDQPEPMEVG